LTLFLSRRRGLLWSIAVLRIMQAREFSRNCSVP
jgi:hypothetical protein